MLEFMSRLLDHIDLRVSDMRLAEPFYRALLPELGFTRETIIEGWVQYAREPGYEEGAEFFGIMEDTSHVANANRIAFRAASREAVDALAGKLRAMGAQNIEGPEFEEPGYYVVFFEDPCGNRLEYCHRVAAER